jgi:DNA-binding Lrp family transcriptional regulator
VSPGAATPPDDYRIAPAASRAGTSAQVGPVAQRASSVSCARRRQEAVMRAIFVMIKCEMGQTLKVAREAADNIEQMSELYSTSGQYDLLGKFYLDPDEDIGRFVTEKVQAVPGVKDTYTLITFNAFTGGGT